jgi:hypothetical protein
MTHFGSGVIEKISWNGVLLSVQPRIRLNRSFDQRSHTYLGYALRVYGSTGSESREFLVGVGESAQAKIISEPARMSPAMRFRSPIRAWRPLNSIRSAT